MALITEFEPSLGEMVREVFQQRLLIKNYGDIYSIYLGKSSRSKKTHVPIFFEKLKEIQEKNNTSVKHISVQKSPFTFQQCYEYFYHGKNLGPLDKEKRNKLIEVPNTFFHFISNNTGGVTKRIYIHCAQVDEATAIENRIFAMEKIVPLLSYPGFVEVKVAGPGILERNDTIVAYLSDDQIRDKVIADIFEKLKFDATRFSQVLPPIIKKVQKYGITIGIADEPGDIGVLGDLTKKDRHSFGSFISKLLWVVLEESDRTIKEEDFYDNVLMMLKIAGINPMLPHLHPEAIELAELQFNAQRSFNKRSKLQQLEKLKELISKAILDYDKLFLKGRSTETMNAIVKIKQMIQTALPIGDLETALLWYMGKTQKLPPLPLGRPLKDSSSFRKILLQAYPAYENFKKMHHLA